MASLLWNCVAISSVLLIAAMLSVNCMELEYSDIKIIGENNSYQILNPQATFDFFKKMIHVKGNIIFSKGQRITGDRLISNHEDSDQFSKPEDVEVLFRYPDAEGDGQVITFVEVLADPGVTAVETNTGFIEGSGGINNKRFELIVQCKHTTSFAYEIFIYGYGG